MLADINISMIITCSFRTEAVDMAVRSCDNLDHAAVSVLFFCSKS